MFEHSIYENMFVRSIYEKCLCVQFISLICLCVRCDMFVCCMFAVVPDSPSLTWPTMSQIQYPSSILKPLGLRASSVMHGLMYDWLPTKRLNHAHTTTEQSILDMLIIFLLFPPLIVAMSVFLYNCFFQLSLYKMLTIKKYI